MSAARCTSPRSGSSGSYPSSPIAQKEGENTKPMFKKSATLSGRNLLKQFTMFKPRNSDLKKQRTIDSMDDSELRTLESNDPSSAKAVQELERK